MSTVIMDTSLRRMQFSARKCARSLSQARNISHVPGARNVAQTGNIAQTGGTLANSSRNLAQSSRNLVSPRTNRGCFSHSNSCLSQQQFLSRQQFRSFASQNASQAEDDDGDSFPIEDDAPDYDALRAKAKKDFATSKEQMDTYFAKEEAQAAAQSQQEVAQPKQTTRTIMRDQQKILFPRLSEASADNEFEEDFAGNDDEADGVKAADGTKSKEALAQSGEVNAAKTEAAKKEDDSGDISLEAIKRIKEVGFKYSGQEPTTYGDWSHKGRVTDF